MAEELTYGTFCLVVESWELAQRKPNFKEKVGLLTLNK